MLYSQNCEHMIVTSVLTQQKKILKLECTKRAKFKKSPYFLITPRILWCTRKIKTTISRKLLTLANFDLL